VSRLDENGAKGENDRTCRRFMAAASPAISIAASITDESLKGAVLNTILLACQQHALVFFCVFSLLGAT